ncbi:MAG: DUF1232 domain-containing protein [Veillonella sp.]|nr:DUF1232 domain-containing protein [Veillonella sp.]MCF0156382.1 DUF1232 domain-containing protein [Veillonella sp.]
MKLGVLAIAGKMFGNSKFMRFASNVAGKFIFLRRGLVLFYCLRDKGTPTYVKVIIATSLGYLILPIDIVPDVILGLGWLDDLAILGFAFKVANKYITEEHRGKARRLMPFGSDGMD